MIRSDILDVRPSCILEQRQQRESHHKLDSLLWQAHAKEEQLQTYLTQLMQSRTGITIYLYLYLYISISIYIYIKERLVSTFTQWYIALEQGLVGLWRLLKCCTTENVDANEEDQKTSFLAPPLPQKQVDILEIPQICMRLVLEHHLMNQQTLSMQEIQQVHLYIYIERVIDR